ncbi:MAG: hypothetical protein IJC15_06870, partial [Clostridia bacterium]|nr:hypothetical protein [Clostridia bacterium]
AHGADYRIADPIAACVMPAECMAAALVKLLSNDGVRARAIKAAYKPVFASKEEYYAAAAEFCLDLDAVTEQEDGSIALKFMH